MPKKPATEKGKAATKKKQTGSRDVVDHALMRGLSHPLRTRILAILNERVSSPNQLSKELHEGLSQVSYHVEKLKKLGLIEMVKTEPRRGAVEHFYRGVRQILVPRGAWKDLPSSILSGITAQILENFFDDAQGSIEAGIFDDPDSYAGWSPLILDREGFKRIDELANEFLEAIFDVQAEASGRLAESGKEGFSATVLLASFLSTRSPEDSKRATSTMQR
ncbi:MAG TPA: winged helix-turn-helix domain-containing protein [Solirubrobacterales bacterium]|nr:winged helix-turn-helix domain-containing protein [Solirubrobacterales bacterium]